MDKELEAAIDKLRDAAKADSPNDAEVIEVAFFVGKSVINILHRIATSLEKSASQTKA